MSARRVFLVDDHALVRAGIQALLEDRGARVVGQAGSAEEALRSLPEDGLDLVIADLSLSGANGLELLKSMAGRWPDVPVLVLSMHDEAVYAQRAVQAGARGYLMKDAAPAHLWNAVETVLAGRIYLSPDETARALERLQGGAEPGEATLASLSDRELEVFERLGQGMTTREISEALHLSIKTVESHRANLKRKLGLKNAAELVRRAVLHVSSL